MDKKSVKRVLNSDGGIGESEGVAVGEIIGSVKRALIETQENMESSGMKIKSIQLKLKSIASENAGAGVTLQIPLLGKLKIGSDISAKSVQTIFLTLKTPQTRKKSAYGLLELDEKLAKGILTLTEGIKAAACDQPILEMGESSIELNFILKSESDISFLIKAGFESELTNTLKVIFEKI
ncbi:trypco2 family protein [Methanobacterium petrolearium]|uniref:trypco2 family protein n=1 Tax=Methanobacterium petrolearium TaxID=710190 RepID=UPI001AE26A0F|nr:trypco2 family protein [Methanobacterium petrolearium]MBP1946610.1 hypothetical protein [Methanobacterium petrolearium]BDZ72168.1 hypothetical protein GCM10025861_26850 [Methanobacterium petrolearium]